jgi:hypothetical protein
MTALAGEAPAELADQDGFHFRLAVADLRRATEAAPEGEQAVVFAAGAMDLAACWSGRVLKQDIVDSLHWAGVGCNLAVDVVQGALENAFRLRTGGAT